MKSYKAVLISAISLLILFSIYIALLYYESGTADRSVLVRVSPGDSFADIQGQLESRGLLDHPAVFRWSAFLMGREGEIKVGEYSFDGSESVSAILEKLTSGAVDYRRVVIPEGLMLTEIASVAALKTGIDSVRFVELASDSGLIDSLGFRGETLEGYLFPDTYLVTWPFNPRGLILRMVRRFGDVYVQEAADAADSAGMSRREVVTLASIIQAEAGYEGEMRKISAVYHN
ncbi:MAG: endolytic transglycosylase MltG, partial [Candidatus Krumholzibacteriota bacterium]